MAIIRVEGGADEAREEAYACLDAFDAAPADSRSRLALQAIRADATLIDAYLAAAEAGPAGAAETTALWLAARELGRLEPGARLQTDIGSLWSSLHGRSYMRACAGYAACCFDRHEFDEAIAQCKRLLALDTADPMEAAPLLGACLLGSGDSAGFEAFREHRAGDASASWLYVDAFHAADAKLPARERNAWLDRALASNRFVPPCLASAPVELTDMAGYTTDGAKALAIAASRPGRLWRWWPTTLAVLLRRARALGEGRTLAKS